MILNEKFSKFVIDKYHEYVKTGNNISEIIVHVF